VKPRKDGGIALLVQPNIHVITWPGTKRARRYLVQYKGHAQRFATEQLAEAALAEWKRGGTPVKGEEKAEPPPSDPALTLEDLLREESLLLAGDEIVSAKRPLYVISSYRAGGFDAYLGMLPAEISAPIVKEVRTRRRAAGLSDGSLMREEAVVRKVLRRYWQAHPESAFIFPKLPKPLAWRCPSLSETEEDRILAALPEPHATIVRLALLTALRLASICALRREQCDLTPGLERIVNVKTKTGLIHVVLGEEAAALLEARLKTHDSPFVFPSPYPGARESLAPGTVGNITREVFRRVLPGRGFHFHDLRHVAVSRMIADGLNLQEIMLVAGLKSYQMVFERYGHLVGDRIRAAQNRQARPRAHGGVSRRGTGARVIALRGAGSTRASARVN
jgi:integrase